jgi:hypothetical protein
MQSLSVPGSAMALIRITIRAFPAGCVSKATKWKRLHFGTIASIRTGHWYRRQGNGDAAYELDTLLAQLEAWSVV